MKFVVKNQPQISTNFTRFFLCGFLHTLMNADYWGRQSVVISKNKEGFTFANPGRLRISKSEAIGGCTSDPRNSTILKFFFLIRFGERAGSGLNGIMYVWNHVMFITQRPQLMRKMERWTGLFSRFLIMVMNKMLMQCCSCTMITNSFPTMSLIKV